MMAVRYPNYELLDTISVQLFMSCNAAIENYPRLRYSHGTHFAHTTHSSVGRACVLYTHGPWFESKWVDPI